MSFDCMFLQGYWMMKDNIVMICSTVPKKKDEDNIVMDVHGAILLLLRILAKSKIIEGPLSTKAKKIMILICFH
ncbi:hypothetical protein TNCT_219771 [Trichonephila clavata]|uniref:Uncharacterized protein n=1 Tax=Trichonephila clavata TaxID=2740835 RepID=A0A8X6GGA5_TRICU|nr:hypothetical protein TNCT_219771 [Trichonephila clavata]